MSALVKHVRQLDPTTFKPFIESNSVVFVCFVMLPISKQSQRFVPEFEKIAYIMQDHGIAFAQMEALGNGDVVGPFEITSFPWLLLFRGYENYTPYRGTFGKSDIVSYLNRFLYFPVLTSISSVSLPDFRKSNDVVVVAYIASHDDEDRKSFENLAKELHPEFLFGISNDTRLARHENIIIPAVALYIKNEETSVLCFGVDIDAMSNSLRLSARPIITSLVVEVHKDLLLLGLDVAYIFVSNQEERIRLGEALSPVARKYRQSLVVAIGDPNDLEDIIDNLHLQPNNIDPSFVIRESKRNLRYPMNKGHAPFECAVEEHVKQFLDGKLQPTVKSEPVPPPGNEALVKVVGLTFQDIVMDNNKDVLLVYCIDPCGPCARLRPTLQGLARLYESDPALYEQVTVAIVDCGLNDVEDPFIQAFPTIKLFPARRKNHAVRHLGGLNLEALADFIRDEGTHNADLRHEKHKNAG